MPTHSPAASMTIKAMCSSAVLLASLVQQDPGLTDAQQTAELEALRASLPEEQRGAIPAQAAAAGSAPTGS